MGTLWNGVVNVGSGMLQGGMMIGDAARAGYSWATGGTLDEFEPVSDWGRHCKDRIQAGQSGTQVLKDAAPDTAANAATLGLYGVGQGAYNYYNTGDPESLQKGLGGQFYGVLMLKGLTAKGAAPSGPGTTKPPTATVAPEPELAKPYIVDMNTGQMIAPDGQVVTPPRFDPKAPRFTLPGDGTAPPPYRPPSYPPWRGPN